MKRWLVIWEGLGIDCDGNELEGVREENSTGSGGRLEGDSEV
jgi:hypothetical protein